MRLDFRIIVVGLLAFAGAGCESTRWNWLKTLEAPTKQGAPANVAAIVKYLNENASNVQTLRVDDLTIDATMGNQTIGLTGRVMAEKPRNFRMKVTALGKDEVDIGSNLHEFWFWAAKNPDPYQYFCSYQDLTEGKVKMMPLPIQPEWVMEAMGLGPYGPAEKYRLETDDPQMLKLVEKATSPQGHSVRKVIVMHRKEMKAPTPQVTAFLLLDDATGQEICSAHITATKVLGREKGAIVPYKMELRMPTQKMRMFLKMDGMTVNAPIAATAFQRQSMPGIDSFNLATGRIEPLQRIQGFDRK